MNRAFGEAFGSCLGTGLGCFTLIVVPMMILAIIGNLA